MFTCAINNVLRFRRFLHNAANGFERIYRFCIPSIRIYSFRQGKRSITSFKLYTKCANIILYFKVRDKQTRLQFMQLLLYFDMQIYFDTYLTHFILLSKDVSLYIDAQF